MASETVAPSRAGGASAAGAGAHSVKDTRTAAQRAFEDASAARRAMEARAIASKSHAERMGEFNAALEKIPEHNDLFKIQYAGTG